MVFFFKYVSNKAILIALALLISSQLFLVLLLVLLVQLDHFQTKTTGWSLINKAVVLNKPKFVASFGPPNDFRLYLNVCLFKTHLVYLNHYIHEHETKKRH